MDRFHGWSISLKPLHLGLISSFILLLAAYRIVVHTHLSSAPLIFTVFGLGILQALLQLIFFLHLGLESKPHWYMITLLFTILIAIIVVGGSIWIMSNLNYNLML